MYSVILYESISKKLHIQQLTECPLRTRQCDVEVKRMTRLIFSSTKSPLIALVWEI